MEVLKQNYGHVYVGQELTQTDNTLQRGFPGKISGLSYFNYANNYS